MKANGLHPVDVYIDRGYGHFAIPESSNYNLPAALAHELTHALIANPELPEWVEEGLTQLCEEAIAGHLSLDFETIREHIDNYWTESTIQKFWNGSGFKSPDEGQTLSYHLSQLFVYQLIKDRSRFDRFAQNARRSDAGEKSLLNEYGLSLQDITESALGEGNWGYREKRIAN